MVIATGSLAVMYRANSTLTLFIVVLAGGVIDLVVLLLCKNKIEVSASISPSTIYMGESVKLKVLINNKSILMPEHVRVKVLYTHKYEGKKYKYLLNTRVNALSEAFNEVEFKVSHIGLCEYNLEGIIVYSFLGLFKKKIRVKNQKTEVFVFPITSDISGSIREKTTNDNVRYRSDIPGYDRTEVFDVRDYRDGDDVKSIHWKLSSKKDSLMVKVFSEPVENKELVYVNYSNKRKENAEAKDNSFNFEEERLNSVDEIFIKANNISMGLLKLKRAHVFAFDSKEGQRRYNIEKEADLRHAIKDMMSLTPCDETCFINTLKRNHYEENYDNIFYITMPLLNKDEDRVREQGKGNKVEIIYGSK